MTDIVARLQLRADQFSSENGRAFAELKQRASSTAQEVRGSWNAALTDVARLTETALSKGVTKRGSLDLTGEIAQLKESAAAADQKAVAYRQLEDGLQRIALADGVVTEKELRRADAAKVGALAAEREAAAMRGEISVLEQLQVELDQVAGAKGRAIIASRQVTAANDNQRQSTIMLGQQVQDFWVQVGSGQSVATAFTQQIGQVAYAVQGMGGKLAGVAGFLASSWGIAATTAVVIAAPLAAKIFETNDALEKELETLKKNAAGADVAAKAKERFARTEAGLVDDVRSLTDEIEKQNRSLLTNAERLNIRSKNRLELLGDRRSDLTRQLDQARIGLKALQQPGVAQERGSSVAQAAAREQIAALETRLKTLDGAIAKANAARLETQRDLAQEAAKRATDASAAINYRYDGQNGLIELTKRKATAEEVVNGTLVRRLTLLDQQRDRELKAVRDAETASKRQATENRQSGRQIDLAEARTIVASIGGVVTSGLRTIQEQKVLYDRYKAGTGPLAAKPGSSDHERGLAVDISKAGGITLAKVRAAFQREGVALTQLLDEGRHIHAAFGRKGAIGDVVSTRAADLKLEKQQAAEAKRANDELERSLEQLAGRYDPLRAAARAYREELEGIAKLAGAGKISQGEAFDYAMRAGEALRDAQGRAFNESARQILGPDAIANGAAELDRQIASANEQFRDGMVDGAIAAGDALRAGVGGVLDLFGVRVSGAVGALLSRGGVEGQARETSGALVDVLRGSGIKLTDATLDKLESKLSGALAGAAYGQAGGSVFASITGGKQNPLASALGGAVGNVVGKEVGSSLLKNVAPGLLKNVLGGAAGPIGAIAGGVLGNIVGGLLKPAAKYGTATLNGSSTTSSGNDAGAQKVASGLGNSISTGLSRIAEQLGGQLGSYLVSIGTYDGDFRVSTSGQTGEMSFGKKNSSKSTLYDFAGDQAAAIEFALRDAISDGAIKGISAAELNILRSGKDLETAITKASLISAVPRDLKAMLDPVGAVVDDLNRKFQKTVDALKEGGATAEQMAQAERLYNLQLQQVKASTTSASASLKDFLTDLKLGSASPYSLRDQEATALAQLKPYLDQIGAGERVDQDKYQAAARAYLDIERQLYGSTQRFFDAQAEIQAATTKAIATIDNAAPITTAVESPFAKATAASAAATAGNTATANDLLAQLSQQMQGVISAIGSTSGGGGGGFDFIGAGRSFVKAA